MHYAKYTFSKNGFEITIQPRAGLYSSEIGQRIRLSPLDIQQANFLYDCPGEHFDQCLYHYFNPEERFLTPS